MMETSLSMALSLVSIFLGMGQALLSSDVQELTVKPGTCPRLLFYCPHLKTNECEDDSDCQGVQKCCSFRCRYMCVEPVLERIGSCPPDTAKCSVPEPNECDYDSDCLGNKKCCHSSCGSQCKSPLPEKMGECPEQSTICQVYQEIPAAKCTNDKQCPGNLKCCTPHCGMECTEPAVNARGGHCPFEETPCLQPLGGDECVDDSNCPETEKCCGTCKKKCTKSITVYQPSDEQAILLEN